MVEFIRNMRYLKAMMKILFSQRENKIMYRLRQINVEDSKSLNTDVNRMLPFHRNGIETVSSKYVKQFFSEKEAKDLILDFYNGRHTQKEEDLLRYFGLG